jgi:hypothetical protein
LGRKKKGTTIMNPDVKTKKKDAREPNTSSLER